MRIRYDFRLPPELYDRLVNLAGSHDAAQDAVEDAVLFWLSIRSEADPYEESLTRLTAEQERLVHHFLRFLKRADPDLVAAVSHIMESWRRGEKLTSQSK